MNDILLINNITLRETEYDRELQTMMDYLKSVVIVDQMETNVLLLLTVCILNNSISAVPKLRTLGWNRFKCLCFRKFKLINFSVRATPSYQFMNRRRKATDSVHRQ